MKSFEEVTEILNEITYKDWTFRLVEETASGGSLLSVSFKDEDGCVWNGRKWYISRHMTKSEIVQTALKAVLTAEEHEAREKFLYKNTAIFGPHLDVETLLMIADKTEVRA